MAYRVRIRANIEWVADGGQNAVMNHISQSAQQDSFAFVPGGDTLTTANISSAFATAAANCATAFNGQLAMLQGWSTGSN
jgi:hypothetical protein